MDQQDIDRLSNAVRLIALITDTTTEQVLYCLIGTAINEEEATKIEEAIDL